MSSVAVSVSPLNKLDGIAIRISDPSSAQLAVEKVMRRREKRRTLGNQDVQCGITIVGPKDDFDPAPFSPRSKAVVLFGCFHRRDSEGEPIQREFDMDRFA
jgi:hypothetical protein